MHNGHLDDEREEIINECIDTLVCHRSPIEMSYTLQFVINEQLRRHQDHAEHVDEPNQSIEYPRVPPSMFLVEERIYAVSCHKGHCHEQ